MHIFLAVLSFIYGLLFGSFFNVCIYRIPLDLSVVKGNSFCPNCKNRIKWYDLVPVISFAVLGGKCRFCKERISPRYTVVELLTGLLFLAAFLRYGIAVETIVAMILLSCLVILSFIDLEHQIIPDRFPVIILALGIANTVYRVWNCGDSPLLYIIGLFAVSVPFLLLAYFGAMGGGDVKLMAAAGLLLGWKNILLAVIAGSAVGAVYAVILLAGKKAKRKTEVPFGPFLSIGIAVAALYGDLLVDWYTRLLSF